MRLDKYLANMKIGTRSQVKQDIKKGLVQINDEVIKKPEQKVDPDKDTVCYRGEMVNFEPYVYYMLHKPAGYLSASRDKNAPVVTELIDSKMQLNPVGRLDKDTEGLLFVTNDGVFAHEMISPVKHVEKTYYAKIAGTVTEEMVKQFHEGLDIGEKKETMPAKLRILSVGDGESEIKVTLYEGKYHQVKRMFQAVGCEVVYLKRISMGGIPLDEELEKGQYRALTKEELEILRGE